MSHINNTDKEELKIRIQKKLMIIWLTLFAKKDSTVIHSHYGGKFYVLYDSNTKKWKIATLVKYDKKLNNYDK